MEAFAAVASGAGLMSLAIQLLESSQKLKGLYNASRNAPKTIEDLCFELETLSLQLRQLERHRNLNRFDTTEVLNRCIAVCQQRVVRVRDVVDAMSRYMRRSSTFGGVYTAFKEPEMRKLIVELEQAKSSLSLAYISYCQSWNMRDSSHQTLALQHQRDLLALQQLQLDDIQHKVAKGISLLTSQPTGVSTDGSGKFQAQGPRSQRTGKWRIHLRLPQFLTDRTWTIATYHSQSSWSMEIHPECLRPFETPALDLIRAGDIVGVKKAIDTGQLSIWDSTWHPSYFQFPATLLGLAVYHGHKSLCEYLLDNVEHFRRDEQLLQALRLLDFSSHATELREEILELFASKYGMDVYIFGPSDDGSRSLRILFYEFSKSIMSHQPLSLKRLPLEDRFNIAMKLRGRSPVDFLATVGLEIDDQLLSMTDERGSTVLHWAALNWSIGHRRKWSSSRLKSYENLIIDLIKAGSPISAINGRGHTPFMYLLDYDDPSDDWRVYGTYVLPDELHPLQIVGSWGAVLSQAGVSLFEYVERENLILSRSKTEHPVRLHWRDRTLELRGVAFENQTTLTIDLCAIRLFGIYESQPMPGSFTDMMPNPCRLPWPPSLEDDINAFWQLVEVRTLKSSDPFQLSPDSIDDLEFDMGRLLFGGTQDDHMSLAAVYQREQQRIARAQNGMSSKSRSSSTPPATKTFVKDIARIPYPHSPEGYMCARYVHKCPQDARWGFYRYDRVEYFDSRATCMAGCSGRPDHGAQIAAAFLPSEKSRMTTRERWLVKNFPKKYGTDVNLRFTSYEK